MRHRVFLTICLAFCLLAPAFSAPLFPDVRDDHWAHDAVATLAAKGLVEGYPDGTFKGDRAASRWEVAMIVARFLAKMEQEHATFATKAEMEELSKLVSALREELDALGVRVTNLEDNVARLDKRVTELERITFYGYIDARMSAMSFRNTGQPAVRSLLPGVGGNTIDYNAAVGSAAGAGGVLAPVTGLPTGITVAGVTYPVVPTFNPFSVGALTVTNWRTGRPLVNGTGFSSTAVLGLRIKVSDEFDAGAEFAAYTSQGNQIIDAYYGTAQPYLSNPWTAITTVNGGAAGAQGLNNQPFTRLTLDNFWIRHNPSQTKLILGSFRDTHFSDAVFAGLINPNEFGPKYLPNFGLQVTGRHYFDEEETMKLDWEVMGTRLPDGNTGTVPGLPGAGSSYWSHAEGFNANFSFHDEAGNVRLNFLHAANDASNGADRQVGLILVPNLQTLNWVNPNGFYLNQLGGANSSTAGFGSVSDIRPIPMLGAVNNDGSVAAAVAAGLLPPGVPNFGGIGPQDQITLGIQADYKWEDNEYEPRIYGEYAHSEYKPNKNSSYSAGGNAFKVGAGAVFLDKALDVDVHYLQVDPRFSPFLIQTPNVGGITTTLWHTPDFNYYNNLYSLHDTEELPHNRQGIRAKVTWKFLPTGRATLEYGNLNQTQTSLQDVRYSAGALGAGVPNFPVLGYSPGFMDAVFSGFSPFTFVSNGTNGLAIPLENPRGNMQNVYFSVGHKWLLDEENSNRGVLLSGGFKYVDFYRGSNLQALRPGPLGTQGQNQNLIDLAFIGWHVGVDYDVTEDFTAKVGFTSVDIFGHLDPFGVTNGFAEHTGFTNFNNVDISQTSPEIGFEWRIDDDVTWSMDGRYFSLSDNVPSRVFTNPGVPTLNITNGPSLAHPFGWEGIQVNTAFSVKF